MSWASDTPDGVLLNVRVQTRSSRAGIEGVVNGEALKVRVRAAPVEGKANREIIETLAEAFDIPKSTIVFKSGETSKTKRFLLRGMTMRSLKVGWK